MDRGQAGGLSGQQMMQLVEALAQVLGSLLDSQQAPSQSADDPSSTGQGDQSSMEGLVQMLLKALVQLLDQGGSSGDGQSATGSPASGMNGLSGGEASAPGGGSGLQGLTQALQPLSQASSDLSSGLQQVQEALGTLQSLSGGGQPDAGGMGGSAMQALAGELASAIGDMLGQPAGDRGGLPASMGAGPVKDGGLPAGVIDAGFQGGNQGSNQIVF